jgi:glycosyltransferase involved in cell wall biosynthesis
LTKEIAFFGVKGLPSTAGADRVVEAIVTGLDKQQYHPIVYCSAREVPPDVKLPGIELVRLPSIPGKHLHATSLFIFSAIHALFLGRYDLAHIHNVEASFIAPLLRIRFPVITTSHGSAYARDKWGKIAKTMIRMTEYPFIFFSNRITSVSSPYQQYYEQQYKKEVLFLPNGVDDEIEIDLDAAKNLLNEYGLQPGKYIMFAAGRVIPTKGCHFLLEALQHIEKDISVLIAGNTTHVPAYAKRLREMADERVQFCSFIASKPKLLGLIQSAKLFVFPSTVEAMSMMLLEVATVGTPILASNIPENCGVLPEEALYFQSANANDLSEKLNWALDHPEAMAQVAKKARARVNTHFRWQDIVHKYEALYEDVISR